MKNTIKVFAPASVSNVGSGFDVMGFAYDATGDLLEVSFDDTRNDIYTENKTRVSLPEEAGKNVAYAAVKALLDHLQIRRGIKITFLQKINPGSGIGSSGASAAAAVFAVNELLDRPFSRKELVPFAMEGEKLVSGGIHADNVAPALIGGFVLVRSYHPLDIIDIPYPENLYCTVIHPDLVIRTEDSRKILRTMIPLKDAVTQWGNTAGLVAGLMKPDYELIGKSMTDVVAEPLRSALIPGFHAVKKKALEHGAIGCTISGSGPSMFAFSRDKKTAEEIAQVMSGEFLKIGIQNDQYVALINKEGARVIE